SAVQQKEPTVEVVAESPGLVQRCVVVQKDQLGFGFTVCGERVKLVQNVRPVVCIFCSCPSCFQVNGSLVSSMSHQEVVKLIKSGTYVALTLQGPPPSAATLPLEPLPTDLTPNQREAPPPPPPPPASGLSSTPSQRITGPRPLQDPEVQKHATQILRKMLEQEEAELQGLLDEQLKNPSPSLEECIERAKRRAHQVRVKIQQDQDGTRAESISSYVMAGEVFFFFSNSFSQGTRAQIIGPEEEDEDEDGYAFNEMEGPFQDIDLLKTRPAHMTVFMRYVFTQLLDPNPLLFYLSVEAYLGSSPKDARALAPQVCSHFLDPDAPLKIKVREEYITDIESRLHAQEDIRGPLSELQQQVLPDIQDQIQDYRNKQMMGLGSLFGEGDLQHLDGDPVKERQVVDRQVTALWEILSKHEEDRSSPLASAVLLYLRHSGIKLRDSKVFPGLSTEKEKWLAFLKTKKLGGVRKEKDGEDKKRNPILKYIGKPRNTAQSMCVCVCVCAVLPGSVRNIIQQFENHTDVPVEEGGDGGEPQRLSSSSLGDDSMDSPTVSVRLARSESLKAQGEGRRRGVASVVESVPRSRSDVDMEDCGEEREASGLRPLQLSASSSASSSSARSLENQTPPYTPRSRRRSVDSPLALLPDSAVLEDEVSEAQNWQDTVSPQLLLSLSPREVERQAVIYELFTTEASHLRTLRVLDQVFLQKMKSVLNADELACIFPNLHQIYDLHAALCEAMKKKRETPVVQDIGDVMVATFEGASGEEFQEHASQLCVQQSQARELIKNKRRKDPRFANIIQECEASPLCRRLQLKDLLVLEMQRLTKYPLLLDNIIKHTEAGSSDLAALQRAQACCRGILQAVNEDVRATEHRQRLGQYQRRLDAAPQFKSLDLTTKRMIHEGSLTWKISKDKQIEIQALLLSDCLLLLQRGPDDRLLLRFPSRWLGGGGGGDSKTSLSPLVKLDSLLVRSVATDNKALYIISTTERQIYELVAGTSSEKNNVYSFSCISHSDTSLTEASDSLESHSSANDVALSDDVPSDQSEAFICEVGVASVAEAALQDVETLRQLILNDLDDDGWSHASEDTPTNETPNEKHSLGDGQRTESLENMVNSVTIDEWGAEQVQEEAPPPDSAVVAGSPPPPPSSSSSVADDITDDVCLPSRNTFYLVLPTEQGESVTDDPADPPTPTATSFPQEEETPSLEEETPSLEEETPQTDQTESLPGEPIEERSQSPAAHQSHVIKNVDEIFHTIEGLMSKLRQLKVVNFTCKLRKIIHDTQGFVRLYSLKVL
uniref:Rho guanine nucleotide exchange factor 11-like n=1 Tax=Gouania willdenowi TaxID=441366 RepID=A0A8C5GKZ8_GOUWI